MREILKNTIRCNNCGDVIESNYRHDYVKCSCGRVAVDGGRDYLRRSFTESPDDYTELSVFNEKRHNPEQISQAITSAFSQSRNGTISRKVEIATLPSRQQGTEVAMPRISLFPRPFSIVPSSPFFTSKGSETLLSRGFEPSLFLGVG